MRTMHLFAGVGGGLLADLILGHTPVVAVEWEPYACQVLREREADGWFPDLRVWEGDVRLFDPSEYAGSVDCIHAGFPCQDISVAGKQAGVSEGTRSGLYREVLRIADTVRPRYLFLENVAAILSNGLGTVLGDLAEMGYDARWCCIRASDVGAPHHRDRWWCLCELKYESLCPDCKGEGFSDCCRCGGTGAVAGCTREEVLAYTDIIEGGQLEIGRADSEGCSSSVKLRGISNPDAGQLHEQAQQVLADTIRQRGRSWQAGFQDAVDAWKSPRCKEYGFWDVESNVGRVANGIPHRVHRLKGLGNGQVPLQAAVAWRLLGGE